MKRVACPSVLIALAVVALSADARGFGGQEAPQYQVVKVCALLTLAEVKKLAPWPPHLDSFAKAEEQALGNYGSSCNYPTADVQVMAFNRGTIDSLKKSGKLEEAAGVGDEAYLRNNRDTYAELYARVGPHLLTVQYNIKTDQKFEGAKPTVIALGEAFAAKLRDATSGRYSTERLIERRTSPDGYASRETRPSGCGAC